MNFIVQHLPSCEGKRPSGQPVQECTKCRDTVGGMGFQAMCVHHPFCPVTIGPPLSLTGCGDHSTYWWLMVRKAYDSQDLQLPRKTTDRFLNHPDLLPKLHKRGLREIFNEHVSRIFLSGDKTSINCTTLDLPSNPVISHSDVFGSR